MERSGNAVLGVAPGASAWAVALAGFLALAVAVGIGRFAFTPVLPMMQEDGGLTVPEGGWLASANYVGYLLGAVWAMLQPARSDHAVRIALLATSIATVAMAYASGFLPWLLLRALAGVASAWALIHVTSWSIDRLAQLRRPGLGGTVFAGVGSGIVLAGALCLVLMTLQSTSAEAWITLGLVGLLVTAALWRVLGVAPTAKASAVQGAWRWTGDALRLVICYGAFGFGYIIPATFVPVMAKQVIGDPAVFGWAWPAFGAAAALSTLCAAALRRAFSNRRLWSLAACLMALGVVSPLVLPGLLGIVAAALLVGGTFMVITMAGIQEARSLAEEARTFAGNAASKLVAAMTAAFAAGQIAGPLLVAAIVPRSGGFSEALLLAFAVLVASAAALAFPSQQKGS